MKEGPLLLHIPNVPEHVTYGLAASAVLIILALTLRFTMKEKGAPSGLQNFFEVIFKGLDNYVQELMGPEGRHYFSLIGTLFLFILVCNLMGVIPGFDSATGNLNTTIALALVAFSATHYIGLKKHKLSYIKHFVGPIWWLSWLMLPIEIISHLARPLSLSVRLFGNIMAKHKLLLVLAMLSPLIPTFPILALGIFVALIQAAVFTLLTMLYLAGSIEEAHGSEGH